MAGVVDQFAEDYVSLEQPGELSRGRAAYRAMLDTMAQRGKWHAIEYRADGLDISGDLAVRYGRFSMTYALTGKDTASEGGNFLHVWRRQSDGSWRVTRDISNYAPRRPAPSAQRVRQ
jgi:ketosteroid isomerase-like protein